MTTLSLSAIMRLRWKTSVTFTADHLIGLVLSGEDCERWLDLD